MTEPKPQTGEFVLPKDERGMRRTSSAAYLSSSLGALLLVIAAFQFDLERLRATLNDGMIRIWPRRNPYSGIALIAYDDASSYRHSPSPQLPADEIVALLDYLNQNSPPKAIGILAPITERNYSDSDLLQLAARFQKTPVFIGYDDDEMVGKEAPELLAGICSFLPGFVSRDTFRYGADGVSRRVMLTVEGIPSFFFKLSQVVNPSLTYSSAKAERLGDSLQTYIRWQGGPGTYSLIPSNEVLKDQVPRETFKDKIVLIGQNRHSRRSSDFTSTPFTHAPLTTPTLEVAAHSLVTVIRENGIQKASWGFNFILTLVFALLTVNGVLFFHPARGIVWLGLEAIALTLGNFISLHSLGFQFDLAHPLLVIGFAYYLVIPFRLVEEYKKRWHFQEKSELMSQLEQLKSNFLSLITHDLKTPIARIQGNAELALNEKEDEKRHRRLADIVQTSQELGEYVETLVDLTQLESGKMPVEKATRDINAAILGVVERKQSHASEKNISLNTELQPIFSFKFDDRLIRRVVGNLVENAIKYSPAQTEVWIRSREEGDRVYIDVADAGPGIAVDDQNKIFEKFYRCESEEIRATAGTGLGLYLARYFVQLHEGAIHVDSQVGAGSKFTISLPVQ